jgi:hypothetical protein
MTIESQTNDDRPTFRVLRAANVACAAKPIRWGALLTGGCLAALSFGAPTGCLGVLSSDEVPTATTTTTYGTAGNPAIVTRDNLALGGVMNFTDSSVKASLGVSATYSDATWTNRTGAPTLRGHAVIKEYRAQGTHYLDQYTPILPDQNYSGSGSVNYGMRAGTMVHGNTYAISMQATETQTSESLSLTNTTYVQLSPDTLLVPVVVVSWRAPSTQQGGYTFVDESVGGRNLFDFNPLYVPNASSPDAYTVQRFLLVPGGVQTRPVGVKPLANAVTQALGSQQYDTPTPAYFNLRNAPDGFQIPVDDVWEQCGIQFQVVAQIEAQLAPNNPGLTGYLNRCNNLSLNFGSVQQIEAAVAAQFASNPTLRDRILYDLMPIYVSYGDGSACTAQGFDGNTPGKDRYVEVNNVGGTGRMVTAHELGHALSLDHEWLDHSTNPPTEFSASNPSGVSNITQDYSNLMASGGNATGTNMALNSAQCAKARGPAAAFSGRYDYFNSVTGRTGYNGLNPPPPAQTYVPPQAAGGQGPGVSFNNYCCLEGGTAVTSSSACPSTTLRASQCNQVCCAVAGKDTTMTQYECTAEGGTAGATGCGGGRIQ